MSEISTRTRTGLSENLVLDDGGIISQETGDDIVAATIHLDHLDQDQVLKILQVLKPYDNNMKVLTKKDLGASAALGSGGLGLAGSAENLSLSKSLDVSAQGPDLSLGGLNGNLGSPGLSLGGLDGNLGGSGLSLGGLDGNLGGSDLSLGGLNRSLGGEINGPSLNGDLPGLSLNTPSLDTGAGITAPSLGLTGPDIKGDLGGQIPEVSVSKPEIKSPKFKPAKFQMPDFHLPKASSDLSAGLEAPDAGLDLKGPDVDVDLSGPTMGLNGPDVNMETPSGKINWPHRKWKGPKVKGPEGNINGHLSTPSIDGDLDLPRAGVKGLQVDGQTPSLDLDAPSGKINWPHLKWKKPNVGGELEGPSADLDLPEAEVKGRNIDLDTPDVKWPHLKWKKPKVPKADVDGSLNSPDLKLSAPDTDINLPKAQLDLQKPEGDLDLQTGKINWPHLKWKKPKLHGPKSDLDLSTGDVDVSVPSIDGELGSSKVDLGLDPPSSKIKFPTLKKPKFAKVKVPEGEAHIDAPNLSLDPVEVDLKAPTAELEAPSGKIKWPTLKKPKMGGGLHVDAPDADLSAPKADVSVPDGKLKWTLKKPKFGTLKSPKADLSTDLNMSPPTIGGGLDTPDLDVKLPDADLKGPDVDLNSPDVDLNGPDLKLPSFNFPKFKGAEMDTNLNGPNVGLNAEVPKLEGGADLDLKLPKADLEGPDVKIQSPDVDTSAGKFKLPKFNLPKFGTSGPKVKGPDVDASIAGPHADVTAPDISLGDAQIKGDLEAPDLNLGAIKGDLTGPDADLNLTGDLDAPSGNFKLPSLKMPKWNLGGGKVQVPDAELTPPEVTAPDLSLSPGTIGGAGLDADLRLPSAQMEAPDLNISSAPGVSADVDLPNVGAAAPDVQVKKSGFHFSDFFKKFGRSSSEEEEAAAGGAGGGGLGLGGELPSVDTSSSHVGISLAPESDGSGDEVEVPAFRTHRLPRHSLDGSEVLDPYALSRHVQKEKDLVYSKGVFLPMVTSKSPSGEKVDILQRLKMAKEKSPSPNVTPTEAKDHLDLKLPTLDLDAGDASLVRGGTFKVDKPALDLGAPEVSTSEENDKMSLSLSNMLGL